MEIRWPGSKGRRGSSVGKLFPPLPFCPLVVLVKNTDGTRANAIFDLALKNGMGRHRSEQSGTIVPRRVHTPRSRLSLFGFKRGKREGKGGRVGKREGK